MFVCMVHGTCSLLMWLSDVQCPFGMERRVDGDGCERCYCYNPCTDVSCGDQQRCAIAYGRDEEGGLIVSAVCRFSESQPDGHERRD